MPFAVSHDQLTETDYRFRFKYPHLVTGALAASANVALAAGVIAPNSYFTAVTDDFYHVNPRCPALVRKAFAAVQSLQMNGTLGLETLSTKFQLCEGTELQPGNDPELFVQWLVQAFVSMTQLDYPYAVGSLMANPLLAGCQAFLDNADDPLTGMVQAISSVYNNSDQPQQCFNMSDTYTLCADQTGCGKNGTTAWGWDYQCCSENFALGTTTNNVTDMFPPRSWGQREVDAYCENRWGIKPRVGWIGTTFGQSTADWKQYTNIIWSNGVVDPFSRGGILKNLSATATAIVIEGAAHHYDLFGSNAHDSVSVVHARDQETQIIQEWLTNAHHARDQETQIIQEWLTNAHGTSSS